MQKIVGVFVSPDFLDIGRLRVWARRAHSEGVSVVLLTDDSTDANSALGRQLRCEGVVHAIMRMSTTLRGREELLKARVVRDAAIIELATSVVVFGPVATAIAAFGPDEPAFGDKPVTRY